MKGDKSKVGRIVSAIVRSHGKKGVDKRMRQLSAMLRQVEREAQHRRDANRRMLTTCQCPGFCYFHTPLGAA